jgi:hypothetical protein
MAGVVDPEVAIAPPGDFVQFGCVVDRPWFHLKVDHL